MGKVHRVLREVLDPHLLSISQIAAVLGASVSTVERVRKRFVEEGLEASLTERHRIGGALQRKLDGHQEAYLVALASSDPPEESGRRRWSMRMLAERLIEARRILRRLEFHYTPKHGSWLNQVEIEFSVLHRQCLSGRIPDKETLARHSGAWEWARNESGATVQWRFTAEDARQKLERLYPEKP